MGIKRSDAASQASARAVNALAARRGRMVAWVGLAGLISLLYSALAQGPSIAGVAQTTATDSATDGVSVLMMLFGGLLVASGLLSSSETALFSLDKLDITQLRNSRQWGNRFILRLLDHANDSLVSILFINTLINIMITLTVAELLNRVTPAGVWWAAPAAAGISTVTIIMFGEIIPKLVATIHPQRVSRTLAPLLVGMSLLITPARLLLNFVLRLLFRVCGIQDRPGADDVSEEELKVMISSGEVSQVLEEDEREMIDGVFDLRRTVAAEIMTPRMSINAVPDDLTQADMVQRLRDIPTSRVLVYHESLDELLGFLLVKEVLLNPEEPWQQHLREAFCVPDGIGLLDLLRSFRTQRTKMAVVVDEYGGVEGIVTLQDLLEEIVGDMYEQHEHQRQDLMQLEPGHWRVLGSLTISELGDELHVSFPEQRGRTVGGFVMNTLGRIPHVGDEVQHEDLILRVETMVARRVNTVLVERPLQREEAGNDNAEATQGSGSSDVEDSR